MLERLTDFIREMPGIYQLRRSRRKRAFFGSNECWGLWGSYESMEHAREQIADPSRATYDNDAVVDIGLEWFKQISLFDYPVVYWLSRLLAKQEMDSIVDFGGHIGVKYYAYRDHLQLPESFKWHVVDVPAMIRRGIEKATALGIAHLEFFTAIEAAPASPVLFCSGSLPYCDLTIDRVVHKMAARPKFILINKLAVLPDREVIALEGFGVSCIPYRVFNLTKFNEGMSQLDYDLVDTWEIGDRTHSIPFVEHARNVKSIGQVWRSRT